MIKTPTRNIRRRQRIRMVKRMLRPLPRRATLHRYPFLRLFAIFARKRAYLWRFQRSYVIPSVYFGAVLAFLPFYGLQIPLAFGAALLVRANLPVMIGLQLITNPLTAAPIYIFTYKVGRFLLEYLSAGTGEQQMVGQTANSLMVGGVVVGLAFASVVDVVSRYLAYRAKREESESGEQPG